MPPFDRRRILGRVGQNCGGKKAGGLARCIVTYGSRHQVVGPVTQFKGTGVDCGRVHGFTEGAVTVTPGTTSVARSSGVPSITVEVRVVVHELQIRYRTSAD